MIGISYIHMCQESNPLSHSDVILKDDCPCQIEEAFIADKATISNP
jgi:hypothetical protein